MGLLGGSGRDPVESQKEISRHSASESMHQQAQGTMQQLDTLDDDDFNQLVESGVDKSTVRRLEHMLSKDFALANFDDAEVTEAKWLTRNLLKKLAASHPPKGSVVQGNYREYLLDDENDGVHPISDAKLLEIGQLLMAVISRHTRGRDGWQQEMRGKQTSVSVVEDNRGKKNGGVGDLFS